jgi:hypothetical protein
VKYCKQPSSAGNRSIIIAGRGWVWECTAINRAAGDLRDPDFPVAGEVGAAGHNGEGDGVGGAAPGVHVH